MTNEKLPPRIRHIIEIAAIRAARQFSCSVVFQLASDNALEIHFQLGKAALAKRQLSRQTLAALVYPGKRGSQEIWHNRTLLRIFARAVIRNDAGLRQKFTEPWLKPYITNLAALIRQVRRAEEEETVGKFFRALGPKQKRAATAELERLAKRWRSKGELLMDAENTLRQFYPYGLEETLTDIPLNDSTK